MYPGQSSPTTVEQVQLQVQTNSPDVSRDRNIGDTERPEYTDVSEIIQDTRSYTILGLVTLLFTYLEQLEEPVRNRRFIQSH